MGWSAWEMAERKSEYRAASKVSLKVLVLAFVERRLDRCSFSGREKPLVVVQSRRQPQEVCSRETESGREGERR